jgi:rubrerythrin
MSTKKTTRKAAAKPAKKPSAPAATGSRARSRGIDAVGSVNKLMAYAYALEAEAAERYAEFAEVMEAHNNREVAELFRKLARIEHKHSEQILEEMNWTSPPKPPSTGYRWEGPEGPETGDITDLHYLMQPYHALQIALHNERRAEKFFGSLAKKATIASVRKAALEFMEEETEHVRLIEEWLARTPKPEKNWALDPDPPAYSD